MFGLTWAGWQVHPLLGLALGSTIYVGLILGLKAFDGDERAQLISILPLRMRERLGQQLGMTQQ
jgi:hypothetical protein